MEKVGCVVLFSHVLLGISELSLCLVACLQVLLISEHGSEGEIRTCIARLDQVNSIKRERNSFPELFCFQES